MIYLDYSATTPVDDRVLETFTKVTKDFIGNPNSLHKLGVKSKEIIDESTKQIQKLLHAEDFEVIYTSGSSESNNLAIKGICERYESRGKHIITTNLEHSSIYGPIGYLNNKGFKVDFVNLDENGRVDINHLKSLITDDTILVSISAVNSEIGIRQDIEGIAKILKEYPKCFFHVDATQCIGKDKIDFKDVDLVSFTAHKFYGIKGIAALLMKKNIQVVPLIHGGKSTTKYRSGTPTVSLIASFAKALRLALEDLDDKNKKVLEKNNELITFFQKFDDVSINHNGFCLPHMLNISLKNIKPETFQHAMEEYDIYLSTQSACSSGGPSGAVYAFTKDEEKAKSSIRISLSYKTTSEELEAFKEAFTKCYNHLNMK